MRSADVTSASPGSRSVNFPLGWKNYKDNPLTQRMFDMNMAAAIIAVTMQVHPPPLLGQAALLVCSSVETRATLVRQGTCIEGSHWPQGEGEQRHIKHMACMPAALLVKEKVMVTEGPWPRIHENLRVAVKPGHAPRGGTFLAPDALHLDVEKGEPCNTPPTLCPGCEPSATGH